MGYLTTTALCLASVATTLVDAHIAVPVSRTPFQSSHIRLKRDNDNVTLEALNNVTGGGYYSEFEVGSPGQKLSFLLDTGSSDTWMNSVDGNLCNSDSLQLAAGYCQTPCEFSCFFSLSFSVSSGVISSLPSIPKKTDHYRLSCISYIVTYLCTRTTNTRLLDSQS